MNDPIISVSGLRGIIGESLSPLVAARYAAAFAAELPPGDVLITRDGRATGQMLADAVAAAVQAMGRHVVYADVAATPTHGVLVRRLNLAGGIQISASHNPPPYNGMKLFGGDGRVIAAEQGQRVLDRYLSGEFAWVPHQQVGQRRLEEQTTAEHLRLILATVDQERIRAAGFNVLLDSNHGAGSRLGCELLDALGCQVTVLGGTPDGQFAHPAEPTAENLVSVSEQVQSAGAAAGFCQDPDADRLAIIDEKGRYVGEEYTLAICLDHVLRQTPNSSKPCDVAANCATSRMSQDLAEKYGGTFHVAPVGEANVVDVMLANGAVFGGEGNGGPIDPRVGYVRDSFVGMALILDAMAARDLPVSALADELPRYAIHKTKVTLEKESLPAALDAIENHFDAAVSRLDGLRLDWDDRWLLIRASNTEPIVRIIAETPNCEDSIALCNEAAEVISKV